jgi:peptidoglycan/LPS O-acetylase OafA/YrhL
MGTGRLVGIDALRGIAALSVVLFHYTTRYDALFGHTTAPLLSARWGWLGVDLFFVISGFVIFMTLARTRRPLDFVVSRASRLYPAYWAAIALTFAITHAGGLPGEQVSPGTALVNLTMLQEFVHVKSVDGVYWTLAVELIFYAWALLLFRLRMLDRIHAFVALVLAVKLVYHAGALHGVDLPWIAGRFLLIDTMPWFGTGIMVYRLATHAGTARADLALIGAAAATLAIGDKDGPGMGVLLLAFAAIVYGAARGRIALLRWRPLVALGGISYALYLVHENIGWTVIRLAEGAGLDANAAIALALAASLALAVGVTRLVEQPLLAWIRIRYAARRTAVASA